MLLQTKCGDKGTNMVFREKKHFILMVIFLLEGGCTPHREVFDCVPGVGVGCKSISEVNEMIDKKSEPIVSRDNLQGTDVSENPAHKHQPLFEKASSKPVSLLPVDLMDAPEGINGSFSKAHLPRTSLPQTSLPQTSLSTRLLPKRVLKRTLKRAPERVLKVWLAPFEDREGHFHEASVIHALVQESRWVLHADEPSAVEQSGTDVSEAGGVP